MAQSLMDACFIPFIVSPEGVSQKGGRPGRAGLPFITEAEEEIAVYPADK